MGLGEMLGVKTAKLNLKGNYDSVEQLYEAIKEIKFEAGMPACVKHGFNTVIVFPELDRNNQVWIMNSGKGKFQVLRSAEVAGVKNVIKNGVLDELTDGWSGMSAAFGNKKKDAWSWWTLQQRKFRKLEFDYFMDQKQKYIYWRYICC